MGAVASDILVEAGTTLPAKLDSDALLVMSDLSDIISELVVLDAAIDSDQLELQTDIDSDFLALETALDSDQVITSDAVLAVSTKIDSDVVVLDAKLDSDMVLETADHDKTQSDLVLLDAPISDIKSELVVISDAILSDSLLYDADHDKTQSDVALLTAPVSDIESSLVIAKSDLVVIEAILAAARGEPGQTNPPATSDLALKIDYLYKAWRNKKMQDATTGELYNDAGAVVDQKWTVADDGTDYTCGEVGTGP